MLHNIYIRTHADTRGHTRTMTDNESAKTLYGILNIAYCHGDCDFHNGNDYLRREVGQLIKTRPAREHTVEDLNDEFTELSDTMACIYSNQLYNIVNAQVNSRCGHVDDIALANFKFARVKQLYRRQKAIIKKIKSVATHIIYQYYCNDIVMPYHDKWIFLDSIDAHYIILKQRARAVTAFHQNLIESEILNREIAASRNR